MTNKTAKQKKTAWSQAMKIAEKAPAERNRYVDFLRAFSILAVVVGHWLVAAPYIEDGVVNGGNLLGIIPWTQWLTWGFQVMPLFFLVGGFSNGVSWSANRRYNSTYSHWFTNRFKRLIYPVLPLFFIWTTFAMFGTWAGVERSIVSMAAQLALIPVWFLSVYIMITALVPLSYALWEKMGAGSIILFIAGAIIIDVLALLFKIPHINFLNFAFVWFAIHQLGYAWNEGYFKAPFKAFIMGVFGLTSLIALISYGPYPIAMIGVPGNDLSNSMPPTIALLALGITQTGFALALEPIARRWLDNIKVWTGTVLINGMIMTIYLWHLTAFVLVMVVAWLLGGIGLDVIPGSSNWWLMRPIWFMIYIGVSLPLIIIFAKFEQGGPPQAKSKDGVDKGDVPNWRLILGLLLASTGLGATAAFSIASPDGVTGVRLWIVVLPFIGAALVRFGALYNLTKRIG